MQELQEGEHSRVYRQGAWVRKVAKNDVAARALAREAIFLDRLDPTLPVPRVIEHGPGFLVETYLEGVPLTFPVWQGWSQPDRARFRSQLWDVLQRLPAGWIHGDLSPDHVLVDPERACLLGIIDFGDASPGQLDYELRYLYEDMGAQFFGHFCSDPTLYRRAAYHSMLDSLRYLQLHPESHEEICQQIHWQQADVGPLPRQLFRQGVFTDAEDLAAMINRSYRSGLGWTHEQQLLDGARVSVEDLEGLIGQPGTHLETLWSDQGRLLGCVCWEHRDDDLHLGMLTVQPEMQQQGWGTVFLDRSRTKGLEWGCKTVSLTVICQRSELIAYYRRRGFRDSGRRLPFPESASVGRPRISLELMEMTLTL